MNAFLLKQFPSSVKICPWKITKIFLGSIVKLQYNYGKERVGDIRPKPDNRINKNQMTEYFWPYHPININTSKLTKCRLDRILGTKQYFRSMFFFGFSVLWSFLFIYWVIWFSILFGPLDLVYWTSSERMGEKMQYHFVAIFSGLCIAYWIGCLRK